MIKRGTGPKSLMEGSKGSQELGSSLTMCVHCVVSGLPLVGGSASPFIDKGTALQGSGLRMRALPSLVAHVYPASLPILMGVKG